MKCHQSYETEVVIRQFAIPWDQMQMHVSLNIKMAGHIKKINISVKGYGVG
jgi:hypothetical protein